MSEAGSTTDEKLALLLGGMTDLLREGKTPDLNALVREHPELEGDLRDLWATILVAEDVREATEHDRGPVTAVTPSPDDWMRIRLDDFEIEEEIGRGGMGIVYRARQQSLDRTVALKMMLRGDQATEPDLVRFKKEAEAAGRLDHANIVPVYEVGSHDGQPFFVMRHVTGSTLAARLREGPMAGREAAELLIPVCRAIEYAHRNGVIHRDLKPSNILLDEHGVPFLSDFGLAKRIAADATLTQTGAILGTPPYVAPEQCGAGGEAEERSDVYSLGAILYHMVTGRPPFVGASSWDLIQLVREEDPLAPRLLNRAVDRDLELVILKCLQKMPRARYNDATALLDDLEAYLDRRPVAARTTGLVDWVYRMLRETHHVRTLENWGSLWMWHSLVLFAVCLATNLFGLTGLAAPLPLLAMWGGALGIWGAIVWQLRRQKGPITFVERQVAHVWGFSIVSTVFLSVIEVLLELTPLTLSPVIAVIAGSVFFVKAGILTGKFYFQAGALYATSIVMAIWPKWGLTIFGIVSAFCFFIPGLKYYRLARRAA